jgi:hypothetical protein
MQMMAEALPAIAFVKQADPASFSVASGYSGELTLPIKSIIMRIILNKIASQA